MKLSAILNEAVCALGLRKRSGQELLDHSIEALGKMLEDRNSCGQSRIPAIFRSETAPILYPITMEIVEQQEGRTRGIFHVVNSITDAKDEIDFSATVETDEALGQDAVHVHMPHWQFTYPITDKIERMCLEGFLIAEAEERVGLEASLGLNGF